MPRDIKVQTVTPGSVSVAWEPPLEPNGKIKTYTIYYTDSLEVSDELWIHVTKNGTEHSAMITISDSQGQLYYFKLRASTAKGPGLVTRAYTVDPSRTLTTSN